MPADCRHQGRSLTTNAGSRAIAAAMRLGKEPERPFAFSKNGTRAPE
jgi:hypothetical protein